jgi:hypothetical protein
VNNLALVTWTNTEYSDIWPLYFGRLHDNYKFKSSYIFLNERSNDIPNGHTQLINNENEPYYKRFTDCLNMVKEDYILYMQEDHIFYDKVNSRKVNQLCNFLSKSDYSFIRLIKSGEMRGSEIKENLFEIPDLSPYLFSQQSAIWKKDDLCELMNFYKPNTYRDVELYGSMAMQSLGHGGCYYHTPSLKRGSMHYDSEIFPYVATAVCKGKWNTNQYPNILTEALEEYSIDVNLRGIYEL